jgi:hypothetical protein
VLAPLRARIVPLRLGLHWPSKPFAGAAETRVDATPGLWPELERRVANGSRGRNCHSDRGVLRDLI